MPEFLLEIGFEEMPAPWLPGLTQQLRQKLEELAAREHLQPSQLRAYSTPRRLVAAVEVLARQADREEKIWGPSLKVARDAQGGWTGAAHGFAKKNAVRPEDLQQEPKDPAVPGELNLLHVRKVSGRPAGEVLGGIVASLLRGLAFPKRMTWDAWLDDGKGAFPFGRPIRWLVALLDGGVVPFTIYAAQAGARAEPIVTSGDRTRGHRFLPRGRAGQPFAVRSLATLQEGLGTAFVVLDPTAREGRIWESLTALGAAESVQTAALVPEWRDLVEFPTVVSGKIPAEFQHLPGEVLETVLVHHQKYIPVAANGHVGRFAALINTDGAAAAEIVRGMERVVVARLRDASFFYAEDMKRPLTERVDDLAGVTFHQGLGTYREKADRLVHLVDRMGREMGLLTTNEHQAAREAALLAKADLTTAMVREFPELQGVMGGLYLRAQGHPWVAVPEAVRWHYHPTSIEEGSPPARVLSGGDITVFGAVSVADKLDTLAGYFGLGLAPTGSSDPFGLRRAAQGVVRVLIELWQADDKEKRPSLRALIAAALEGYGPRLKRPAAEVARDLESFLVERIRAVFAARGFAGDEIEAVLGAREPDALDDPHEAWRRVNALHRVRLEASEDFEHLAVAFKRARNIGADQAAQSVDAGLLQEEAERQLHEAIGRLKATNGGYESQLRSLSTLRGPVDRFFDDVLVMAEDPKLRANRLGLLSRALSLFYRIADISKLGG